MKVVNKDLDLEERNDAKKQLNDSSAKRRDKFYLNDPESTARREPKPKKDPSGDVVMDAPSKEEEFHLIIPEVCLNGLKLVV